MKDKTEVQLLRELAELRQRIAELEAEEAERKRVMETLRSSEALFHSLIESLPQNIFSKNVEGQFTFANQRYCMTEGKSLADIIGKTDFDLHPLELAKKYREDDRRVIETERTLELEEEHQPKNGERSYVQVIKTPVYDSSGQVTGVLGIFWDITERKQAEAAQELRIKQLAALSRASQAVTASLELDQVLAEIVSLTSEVVAADYISVVLVDASGLMGQSAENVPGVPAIKYRVREEGLTSWIVRSRQAVIIDEIGEDGAIIPNLGEGAPRLANPLIVQAGVKSVAGLPLMVKDRLLGVLHLHSLHPGTFHGQLSLLTAFANQVAIAIENARLYEALKQELVERQRVEQLLQTLNAAALAMERAITHEEIFAAIAAEFKKLGFSCMVLLADESQNRLFLRYFSYEAGVVKAVEKLTGLKLEGLSIPIETMDEAGKLVWEKKAVFIENAADAARQWLPEPARSFAGQVTRMLKVLQTIVAPLVVKDKVIGALAVQADDLTEGDTPAVTAFAHQMAAAWRKADLVRDLERSLAELRRTQDQLVQAQKMEAIGRLAGGVAHDFNNLLTAIIGYSELLLMGLDDLDPRRKDMEEIKKAADRAAVLTRQLLAFSRKQVLQPRVLDLNTTIANMEKMLRRLIREDIELITVLDPNLGQVKADPGQIEQVLMNLAVNARDAMPQGGKLTIETKNVYLDEDYAYQHMDVQPGYYVMLAVSDTGVGMDEETLSHLFEPFFTTKEIGQGTGLGLSTIYGIVKQSGGHIWVYSEPGQGTTFKIYLLRTEGDVEPGKRTPIPTESLEGSETILLVEDADAVRDMARLALLQSGYTVLAAHDGEEALQIYEKHEGPVHLLVTDVVMPGGMSGCQLAERLTTQWPEMKVLFMSGYADDAIVRHGLLKPGVTFLQKPFAPATLTHKVRETLDAP